MKNSVDKVSQLIELSNLLKSGVISNLEYDTIKAQILSKALIKEKGSFLKKNRIGISLLGLLIVVSGFWLFSGKYLNVTKTKEYPDLDNNTGIISNNQEFSTSSSKRRETWNGSELSENERIIHIKWDKSTTANQLTGYTLIRPCSNWETVPAGKIWVLLYGKITYKDSKNNFKVSHRGPDLVVYEGRGKRPEGHEIISVDNVISLKKAKDNKLKIYSGEMIRGWTPGAYCGIGDDAVCEIYFLEINEN